VQLTDIVPFWSKTLAKMAATTKGPITPLVVDGQLITGQNPASSEPAAQAVLRQLKGE
jgi:putative intracellular protease/amidase